MEDGNWRNGGSNPSIFLSPFLFSLLLLLSTMGCEESVNPRLGIDRPFTLWGMINPRLDTHAVRVFEIEPTIRLVRPDPIDATVTSTHLQTGETRVWRDSVIQLPDGDFRHVYFAVFDAEAGDTYRIVAERSDGAASSAEVTVPPPVALEITEPNVNQVISITLPIFIRGEAPSLPRIDLDYNIVSLGAGQGPVFTNLVLQYEGQAQRVPEGWLLNINLSDDFLIIRQALADRDFAVDGIELREMELRVHVGNEGWVSPTGAFDADALGEPGALSNVVNGFGFIGSGFVESIRWRPPDILIDRAGFAQ